MWYDLGPPEEPRFGQRADELDEDASDELDEDELDDDELDEDDDELDDELDDDLIDLDDEYDDADEERNRPHPPHHKFDD